MRVNVYVDGFNLYYGLKRFQKKGKCYKWLNVGELARRLVPRATVGCIRYFTALVTPHPANSGQDVRQQTFIRALETIPNLSVHYGHFLSHRAKRRLVNPPAGGPRMVEIWDTEEKGSDVNLATLLLCDAFAGDYDLALVISNDSDLAMPIEVVCNQLNKRVGVFNPHDNPSVTLRQVASFYQSIWESYFARSQFPPTLTDAHGTITKPAEW